MRSFLILSLLCCCVAFVGCVENSSTDKAQKKETEQRLTEAHKQVGMPDITRWTEKKLARDIMELRDKEITTYAYIVNLNGDLIFLGEAIGYGLPYSVQYTNPSKIGASYTQGGFAIIPQAEANGLFMPDGLSATWVMLKGPDGKVRPVYVESELIVSPFKLKAINVGQGAA
ncbi:MAG: hypothetical protein ACYS7Y_11675 [Planctomycetota bacterium]